MFYGLSITQPSNNKTILPITTRQAIVENCTSSYKTKRRCRARQLRSLHNEILNNDREWVEFHGILQQQMVNGHGMTNSAIKMLLFEALETFKNKDSFHLENEATNNSSEPIDIISSAYQKQLLVHNKIKMCKMFTGSSTLDSSIATHHQSGRRQSQSGTTEPQLKKKTILPGTTCQANTQNCSSSYKSRHINRARQLRSLHNEILNNDQHWEEFHCILQTQMDNGSGMTSSAVKALLYEALETFKNNDPSKLPQEELSRSQTVDIKSSPVVADQRLSIYTTNMHASCSDLTSHIICSDPKYKLENTSYPMITETTKEHTRIHNQRILASLSNIDSLVKERMEHFIHVDVRVPNESRPGAIAA